MAITVFTRILQILPTIKNKHFEEEREWRLISYLLDLPKKHIKFRPGKTAVIPYYELELAGEDKILPIKSIIIGPTPNKEESLQGLTAMLKIHNILERTTLDHSRIPYREI